MSSFLPLRVVYLFLVPLCLSKQSPFDHSFTGSRYHACSYCRFQFQKPYNLVVKLVNQGDCVHLFEWNSCGVKGLQEATLNPGFCHVQLRSRRWKNDWNLNKLANVFKSGRVIFQKSPKVGGRVWLILDWGNPVDYKERITGNLDENKQGYLQTQPREII